jgi:signal transduction histidine kinase
MSDEAAAGQHLAWRLSGASWDEVTSEVVAALEQLAQRLGADRSYVTVYHDDGTFENLFEWTASGVLPQLPVIQRLRSDDFAHTSELARHGEVFVAAAISELPESAAAEQRSFSSFGVAAVLQVPIVVDGEGIGLVGINHFAPVDGWADDEVAAVGEIGRAIGTALVRARAAVATDRAEEAQADARRARNELLAHVSHELRTPLHGLLGYSELLRLELRDEADRHALAQIETSGRRLLAMIRAVEPGGVEKVVGDLPQSKQLTLEHRSKVVQLRDSVASESSNSARPTVACRGLRSEFVQEGFPLGRVLDVASDVECQAKRALVDRPCRLQSGEEPRGRSANAHRTLDQISIKLDRLHLRPRVLARVRATADDGLDGRDRGIQRAGVPERTDGRPTSDRCPALIRH